MVGPHLWCWEPARSFVLQKSQTDWLKVKVLARFRVTSGDRSFSAKGIRSCKEREGNLRSNLKRELENGVIYWSMQLTFVNVFARRIDLGACESSKCGCGTYLLFLHQISNFGASHSWFFQQRKLRWNEIEQFNHLK